MFARFRQTLRRLQVSRCETTRDHGQARQSHVAALGSVPLAATEAHRVRFWRDLHQRLGRLGNRINDADRMRILTAVHEWMPMPEDQHGADNVGREANAETFGFLRDKHLALAETYREPAEREGTRPSS